MFYVENLLLRTSCHCLQMRETLLPSMDIKLSTILAKISKSFSRAQRLRRPNRPKSSLRRSLSPSVEMIGKPEQTFKTSRKNIDSSTLNRFGILLFLPTVYFRVTIKICVYDLGVGNSVHSTLDCM